LGDAERWVTLTSHSEQCGELVFRHPCFPDNRPQRAFGQVPVIGNRQPGSSAVPQDDVAARQVIDGVSKASEPTVQEGLDVLGAQLITELLEALGIGALGEAVV
jgi:hypothetical protein